MKRIFVLIFLTLVTFSVFSQENDEKKAIIEVIDKAYVQGIHNAKDIENINKGFHPGFNLLGVDQRNNLTKLPIYTWESGVRSRVEAGQLPKVETTAKYPMVDITGNAAVVKVELFREGNKIYTDYLMLYKFEEGWRIVSKIYHSWPQK